MRESRQSSATAYDEFIRQQKPATLHIFVEGIDDLSIYEKPVSDRWYLFNKSEDTICTYKCGSKQQVYEVYRKINNRQDNPDFFETLILIYFVDRDLSDVLEQDYIVADNIFVTDYYSIESYLTSLNMLRIVLTQIINFHYKDKPDIDKLKSVFSIEHNRFYEYIKPIMLYGIYHKKFKTKNFDFDDIDLNKIFQFEDLELKWCDNLEEFSNLITKLDQLTKIETPKNFLGDISAIQEKISLIDPLSYVRGKFNMWFFLKIIRNMLSFLRNDLKILFKDSDGLLGKDNIIKTLGTRLSPLPQSLVDFIKRNIPQSS